MPTFDQLNDNWEAEMHIFGGSPLVNGYPKRIEPRPFTGEIIGEIRYSSKTKRCILHFRNEEKKK